MLPALLFFASIFAADATAQSIHIPLSRRAPVGPRSMEDYTKVANDLRLKYGYISPSHEQKRQNSADISMINHNTDSIYTAVVNIGTPPQSFNLILDTGSADTWVPILQCSTCAASIRKFDTTKSSTFIPSPDPVVIRYGSGTVSGTVSQDIVGTGGFMVPNQTFLSVTRTSANLLRGSLSGIMGLAFSTIAASGATPFWQVLLEENLLSAPEMSFQFTRFLNVDGAGDEEYGGVFTLGGTNSSLYQGDIEFLNFPSSAIGGPSFWLLELTTLTVNGLTVETESGAASLSAIDTGTTLIGGPTRDVNNFWSAVDGAVSLNGQFDGFFIYPCETKLQVTISFGGKLWPINPEDMNLGPGGIPGMCLGGIFDLALGTNIGSSGRNPRWVVGDTFLKNVYSVFRAQPPSIGFAQLSGSDSTGPPSGTSPGGRSASPTPSNSAAEPFSNRGPIIAALFLSLAISLLAASHHLL